MVKYKPHHVFLAEMLHFEVCKKFMYWYERAARGDHFIYYIGSSLTETTVSWAIKRLTWDMAVHGELYLTQHKIGPGEFQYIAQRSRFFIEKLVPLDYFVRRREVVTSIEQRLANGENEKRSRESRETNIASDAGSPFLFEGDRENGDGSPRPGGLQNTQDQIIATIEPGDTELPR